MIKIRFDETQIPIRVDLLPWLTAYGLAIGDRTDAVWMVKGDKKDPDEDALYRGDEVGGGIVFDGAIALLYLLDFERLAKGQTYQFGLGLKFPGDPRFREVRLGDHALFIEQDFIRA